MKKLSSSFLILLLILLSSSSIAFLTMQIPRARATYVEGIINQDTVWSLVDSPFIVSKNVTILSNATLTIEPGVEIRFGGPFGVIVSGTLKADGATRAIRFTVNDEVLSAKDWNGLVFSGASESLLYNCLIEHAYNAITVTNGDLRIDTCEIRSCSAEGILATNALLTVSQSNITNCGGNGINATSSTLSLANSKIVGNTINGIAVTGAGNVNIQGNTIIGNGNGIFLTGNHTSGVTITGNVISANTQAGISIKCASHSNINIMDNTVSSNNIGFQISTLASTHIEDNSVSFNNVGFYYETGSHTATRNDIVENQKGMDIAIGNSGPINAEQNYWGSSSGPYHYTLNPEGSGNPVGGNGASIDFIFFLTAPIGYVNLPPTAVFISDKSTVLPNQIILFFATNSHDEGSIDWYRFEFGDNETSGWTTLSVFAHKYSSSGLRQVRLTVMDDFGATSQSSLTVNVQAGLNTLEVDVAVNSSNPVVTEGENLSVTVFARDSVGPIENAGITMFAVNGGKFSQETGFTNASGYFTTIFIVTDIVRPLNLRIIAIAAKANYADASGFVYLEVHPYLEVQISANPEATVSESTSQLTINVMSNNQPVSEANIVVRTDFGELSPSIGVTNTGGICLVNYTAPQTITLAHALISVTAHKTGYVDGTVQITITVEPKILKTSINASPETTFSGETVNLTIHVEYADSPVEGVNVTVSAPLGDLKSSSGVTDAQGTLQLLFGAPLVANQTNLVVVAHASSPGYADGQSEITISVFPKTFVVSISASTVSVDSEGETTFTVNVTCAQDNARVEGANVTLYTMEGFFRPTSNSTSLTWTGETSNGTCYLFFYAPRTDVSKTVNITVTVTKAGYVDASNQTSLNVNAAVTSGGNGWSIFMLLLIIVPVAVIVVVVVLLKMKVIGFSVGEGEESVE